MSEFCHLHTHTEFSLLDGACRIEELVAAVKNKNMDSIAITDHGVMYGVIQFYDAAVKNGIKPIIGCEVYTAARTRFDKTQEFDYKSGHLILLCENNTGYHNLMKIVSYSFTDGFYRRPRVDKQLLKKYHKGIIALSACMAGDVQRAILEDNYEKAISVANELCSIFGKENFFLELQDHKTEEDKIVISGLLKISEELDIPLVATNDVHYIEKEDSFNQKVLTGIQTNTNVNDNVLGFKTNEFYLKTPNEMQELFSYVPKAIENTVKIANRCNVKIEYGKRHLPKFKLPDDIKEKFNAKTYLRFLCEKGLIKRYGNRNNINRLDYELSVIDNMGFNDYFLIVYDFVKYAKTHGIPTGPGRGSAAGSLAAYCLGITDIDPIKHSLLFERFLNPERISMPDIDIDFCYERRSEVIDYVIKKYGFEHVAQIITFGTMAARAVIRDVGRALDMPYNYVDKVAKMIPSGIGVTLKKALYDKNVSNPLLLEAYNSDEQVKKLIDIALKLEGMPRHASTHAAGIVICAKKVNDYVPLAKNDDFPVTQYTMNELEKLGLLKMDFLGLRYLSVIDNTVKMVLKKDKNFDIKNINEKDKKTFELLSSGKTDGLFQLESAGMRNLLMRLKPEKLEDITAVIALYRPGPMQFIPNYLEYRQNPEKIKYKHELLKDILSETFGCIIYQEQVMMIVQKLAGFTLGQADLLRRAMSKKKLDIMEKQRRIFLYGGETSDNSGNIISCEGAINRGVPEKTADEIFDQMTEFAKYAFNKSHAAAYAALAYQCAYLKAHYPKQYMASLLGSVRDNMEKVQEYVSCLDDMNIKFLPPSVNSGTNDFVVTDKGIEFSLSAIKNIGTGIIEKLVSERKSGGRFKNIYDFCRRMCPKGINKKAVESLIKSGAFDDFGFNRRTLLLNYDNIFDSINNEKRNTVSGQIDLFNNDNAENNFGNVNIIEFEEFSEYELAAMERDITGLYITGHPLKKYNILYKNSNIKTISEIMGEHAFSYSSDIKINLLVMISEIKLKKTKKNENMCFLNVSDFTGVADCIVFPDLFRVNADLKPQDIIYIKGKVQAEDESIKIICLDIKKIERDALDKRFFGLKSDKKLYLIISNLDEEKELKEIFLKNPGNTLVYFYLKSKKQWRKMNYKVNLNIVKMQAKKILGNENVIIR